MLNLKRVFLVLVLTKLVFHLSQSKADSLDIVLKGYFKAVGGIDRWQKVNSIKKVVQLKHYDTIDSNPISLKTVTIFKKPYFFYNSDNYSNWISDGKTLWRTSGARELFDPTTAVYEVADIMREAIVKRDFNLGITDMILTGKAKRYLGIKDFKGTQYYAVEVLTEYNFNLIFYFDRMTMLVTDYKPTAKDLNFYFFIEKYKEFNGIKIPIEYRAFNNSNNYLEGIYELLEIEFNPTIPDRFFSKETINAKE